MHLYERFCEEAWDENGVLCQFSLHYPADYNFGYDVLDEMGRLAPGQRALVWCNPKGEERIFTFGDLARLSSQTALVLRNHGVKQGDRVMVILKRHYEYWYVAPALHKLGAVLLPATHMLTREDLAYRIQTAGVSAAVCTPDGSLLEDVLAVQEQCPELKTVFTVRRQQAGTVDLTREMEGTPEEISRVETRAEDPMIIYFTSGTTGYPKASMHDHTYSLAHIVTARHWQRAEDGGLHLSVSETGWGKASWGKIYGQWLCGAAVMVYDFDAFSPRALLNVLARYEVNSFCAPPTTYRYLVKFGMDRVPLPHLRSLAAAGEALHPEVFRQVEEQTGLKLAEAYGQTETALIAGNFAGMAPKPGSMGKPSPLYDTAILREDGSRAPAGETGELVIVPRTGEKQHGIFMGYFGSPELNTRVWRGGVYHTGDTVRADEDGYYWYVGRTDDLIKTRGYRVGPFEVENAVMKHPAVLECAVIGVPDKNRGQAIQASVKLAEGYTPTKALENEIRDFANARLASYKWITFLRFTEEMPKTISGKIRRTALRAEHAAAREAGRTPWQYTRRVRYYETDRMGVVHHSNYLRFLEDARMEWMAENIMNYKDIEAQGIIIPAVSASQEFKAFLWLDDPFSVSVRLTSFNGLRLRFSYEIHNTETGALCYTGHTDHYFAKGRDYHPVSIRRSHPVLCQKFQDMLEEPAEA